MEAIIKKIKQIYLVYELRTAISMLEPWEKGLFNTMLLLFIIMFCYSTYTFVPGYTRSITAYFNN